MRTLHSLPAWPWRTAEGKEKTQEFKIPVVAVLSSAPRAYFAPYHFATHNTRLQGWQEITGGLL